MNETEKSLRDQIEELLKKLNEADEKIKVLEKRLREVDGRQDWIIG